jgi:hypothetical protein
VRQERGSSQKVIWGWDGHVACKFLPDNRFFPSQQAERHASAEPLDGGLRLAAARVGQPVPSGLAGPEAF